jgi:hypothetical protein
MFKPEQAAITKNDVTWQRPQKRKEGSKKKLSSGVHQIQLIS